MGAVARMRKLTLHFLLFVALTFAVPSLAQISADFSGSGGGSVKLGYDSGNCDSSRAGAIRYNSAASCAEFCDGTGWTCPNSGGGCVAPSLCPNVGDVCDDSNGGTSNDPIFAGFMFYNATSTCEPLFVTNQNQSTGVRWRNPNTGANEITPDSFDDGRVNSGFIPNSTTHPAFKLCKDLTDGGFSDWYLPSPKEMALLGANRSAIDANSLQNFNITSYWTSAEGQADTYLAYAFNFDPYELTYNAYNSKDINLDVRCVRRD